MKPFITNDLVAGHTRWPREAEALFRELMIAHNFYTYHKYDRESNEKWQAFLASIREYICEEQWDEAQYGARLKQKLLRRLDRGRTFLVQHGIIIKQGQWYIVRDQEKRDQDSRLEDFLIYISDLGTAAQAAKLHAIFKHLGPTVASIAIGRYIYSQAPSEVRQILESAEL